MPNSNNATEESDVSENIYEFFHFSQSLSTAGFLDFNECQKLIKIQSVFAE